MIKTMAISIVILFQCVCYAGEVYKTKADQVASVSEEHYRQAIRVVADKDKEAFNSMIASKKIFIMKEGMEVFIVDRKNHGIIKIRPKGSTIEVWTAAEAVKK